jgi:PIN domain nuclease of toxin-antitoxin system
VTARSIFDSTDEGEHRIYIPSISLVEMIYLMERGRIEENVFVQLLMLIGTEDGSYVLAPLDLDVVLSLHQIPRSLIPDMPDRIIAATAHQRGIPLITRDGMIEQAGVAETVW